MNAFCFVLCEKAVDMRADKLAHLIFDATSGANRVCASCRVEPSLPP